MEFIIRSLEFYEFGENELICQQGQQGTYFFITQQGEFDVLVNENHVNTLVPGKAFGEIALIHNCPRSATVKASATPGKYQLWGIPNQAFRKILKEFSERQYQENISLINKVGGECGSGDTEERGGIHFDLNPAFREKGRSVFGMGFGAWYVLAAVVSL